jgi:diguanylate cyclase (GGDEF)-like protein/PAS domain S-box-containing protein
MLDFIGERMAPEPSEEALSRLNRELRAIGSCQQAMMRARDEPTLLAEVCRIVCEEAGYLMAWVGYAEHDEAKTVRPVAHAGCDSSSIEPARVTWREDDERGRGPMGTSIRTGATVWSQDWLNDPRGAPWREFTLEHNFRGVVSLPLKDEGGEAFGALNIYADARDAFDAEEIRLLEDLAADLAFGVLALRHREESLRANARLQADLRFFECMDRVNRTIREVQDVEAMMRETLDLSLDIFACDRAWLISPCDPDAPSWTPVMQRCRAEYPAPVACNAPEPMTPGARAMRAALRAAAGPVSFDPRSELPVPEDHRARHGVLSMLAMAIYPKNAEPHAFGLHQCTAARVWTDDEKRLLEAIGHRLQDGLTSLLAHNELSQRESQLSALVRTLPDLVWIKNLDGVYLRCNPPFERLNGLAEKDIVGKTAFDLLPRDEAEAAQARDQRAIEADAPQWVEEWKTVADGGRRLFELARTALRDETGKKIGVLGVARDISDRRKIEERLRVAAVAFEAQEGILIAGADRVIQHANRAFTEITGYALEELIGQEPSLFAPDNLVAHMMRQRSWRGETSTRRKNGEVFPAWATVAAVRGGNGEITHYVVTITDIGARKRAEKQIETLVNYDPLTRLPNRRLLLDRLQQALARGARSGRKGALLLIDLDNFKLLNETSGHDVGDKLLFEVARRLSACVGDGSAARIGGDEFAVLMEDLNESPREAAAFAERVGERILAALNEPYALAGGVKHSSPSIGVTVFVDGVATSDELLKQADIALYAAKAAGRNRLRFFNPETQAALAERSAMDAALRVAVRERQFELFYQPQVDRRGARIGAEALLRWRRPDRGLVSPGEFIPVAEENGLILPIGQWVLQEACARLKVWAGDPRARHLRLSVNVSARQFHQDDFADQVRGALRASGAPARRLVLELTESVVLDDVDAAIDKMNALRALGVGFAIDDFGVGYSSLSYLTRLPLDQLKIDRSFVRKLPESVNDAAVARTIIALAGGLGLSVIAEGVETAAQQWFLESQGCPFYQGYLFGRPMQLADYEASLS